MSLENDLYNERVKPLEPTIVSLANRFNIYGLAGVGVDDLVQIGSIAAWEASRTLSEPAYLIGAAKRAIQNKLIYQFRKKRHPSSGLLSLDSSIGLEENSQNLHDQVSIGILGNPTSPLGEYFENPLGTILASRFGSNYARVMKGTPGGSALIRKFIREAVRDVACLQPEQFNLEFFSNQKILPILKFFYRNNIDFARSQLFPEVYKKDEDRNDSWRDAANLVKAFWNSSEPIPDLESRYIGLVPNGLEVLESRNRRGELIPWRSGYSFLLHKGLGVSLNDIVKRVEAFSNHTAVIESWKTFYDHCRDRKIDFPKKDSIPYSWRAVCSILSNDLFLEDVPITDLLDTYSFRMGIDPIDLVRGGRSRQVAHARAGFFYLINSKLNNSAGDKSLVQEQTLKACGFGHHRSIIYHQGNKAAKVLKVWRKKNRPPKRISAPSQIKQLNLIFSS